MNLYHLIYFISPIAAAGFITSILFERSDIYNMNSGFKKKTTVITIFILSSCLCFIFPDKSVNIDLNSGVIIVLASGLYSGIIVSFSTMIFSILFLKFYVTSLYFPSNIIGFLFLCSIICGYIGRKRIIHKKNINFKWLLKISFFLSIIFMFLNKSIPEEKDSFIFVFLCIITGFMIFFKMLESGRQSYLKDLEKKENLKTSAQFELLKSQINPHFLFNTLNTIASFIHRDPNLSKKLIINLSNFLRITLKNKKDFIYLKEEIDYLKQYIEIEKARFSSSILFNFSISNNSLNYIVPFFILQPLVENCIKHGRIENKTLEITISSRIDNKTLHIIISDNGKGIDENVLQNIFTLNRKEHSIGISNIKKRFDIIYKKTGIFNIQSNKNIGTRIHLTLPNKINGENNEKNFNS